MEIFIGTLTVFVWIFTWPFIALNEGLDATVKYEDCRRAHELRDEDGIRYYGCKPLPPQP